MSIQMACADPGIFVRGVQVNLTKKLWQRFFLVLSLFYRSQMVKFKENYHFSRFQRGSNIFQGGGVQLFPGGSNCLFPIETHITCAFPGGSGSPAPPPSLDPHLHASFEWLTKTLVGHCMHTVVDATWTEKKLLSPLLIWAPQLE